MLQPNILWIGRTASKDEGYVEALQKRYTLQIVPSGKQAVGVIEVQMPQVVIVNALSMRSSGERICRQIRQTLPQTPIVHLHPGPCEDQESPADVLLFPPFTSRKLLNCVERLLKAKSDEIIQCGPYAMNVSRRILVAHGQETQLTPKLARLVEFFLRHPNETVDRKTLMETIWQTDYLGDTRTLDVHVRWLRNALEHDGQHPRHLKTVRGTGYRLELLEPNGHHR